MTLQEFEYGLKQACPETYKTAAPKGATRYVVWAPYGVFSQFGDDKNQINLPKVQIDIITNKADDTLYDDVTWALWLMDIPWSVQSDGYDPEYNAMRTILQVVVG